MKWDDVPDRTTVLVIQSATLESLSHVELASYASRNNLLECATPHQTLRLDALYSFDNPPLLYIDSTQLAPLAIGTHGWVRLRLDSGDDYGSDYVVIHWDEDRQQLVCDMHTINVGVTPAWGQSPLQVDPLDIQQRGVPQGKEWVALSGRDGDYARQAMIYALIEEFGERLRYVDTNLGLNEVIPGHPQSLTFDDQLEIVAMDDNGAAPRTRYVRLFPPDELQPVSADNLASKRRYVQWYPVEIFPRATDPISTARGTDRFYQYLQWVGQHAPGRVQRAMIVSHAIVRGPTHFSRNGQQSDFSGRVTTDFLNAFTRNGSFHVTGCNSNSSVVRNGDSVLQRQEMAVLEGNIRAAARLRDGLQSLRTYLEYVENGINVAAAEADSKRIIGELFDDHPDFAGVQRWRIPGDTEGSLKSQNPTYSWSGRGRDGDIVARQRNTSTHIERLQEFATRESNTAANADDAIGEVDWLLERTAWDRVGELSWNSKTFNDRLKDIQDVLSADVHYMAAFAHFAALNGRPDIAAYGGNPGQDGQHLTVTITVDDGNGHQADLADTQVTAYTRAAAWSAYNRPWLVALYRRFGLYEADVYGYFRYDGKLDGTGRFVGNTGPNTQNGCDYGTVNP
ncbi:MAG: hypothetical protein H6981_10755 [Gammaproteobacteria bacterium]|nr:hypothetical protein [Gammaproteobacteria bacterium]MCP5137268.1 hypothetical protein [Gammaproteobacteria bacterium]